MDIAMSHNCLGWAFFNAGRLDEAERSYLDALERAEHCGSTYEAARALTGLGNVAATRGATVTACQHWDLADERHVLRHPIIVGELRARQNADLTSCGDPPCG